VRGMLHRGTMCCRRIATRCQLGNSWRNETGTRDLRLDLMRGIAVIAMIADHIGGEHSWLYAITGGDAFFISAAEVFIFISGLLMGLIYAGVIARQGLGVALMKSLQRAWTLYLLTITLTLTLMTLSVQLRLDWGAELTYTTWFDVIVSVLTLHRTFYLTDILLLYTLLVLSSVPVLVLLVQGQTRYVLTASWGLWMLWQLAPQHAQFPWYIAENSVFNFPAWQALFVTAMVMGYHRHRFEQYWAQVSERMVLGISGAFVAVTIAVYVAFVQPSLPAYGMLVDQVFGKVDLRIGRLLVFAGFYSFALALAMVAWAPIRRALGWLLLPLGQDALSAYILHLFVVALAMKVRPLIFGTSPATSMYNALFQIAGIMFIWTAITLRPMGLTWLHAWFAKVAALLAAGRAYLYVPGHSNRNS
jgi:hypothetical protein